MGSWVSVGGWSHRALALLFALVWLLSADPCFASLSYPTRIKDRWAVPGKLPAAGGKDGCLLCHTKEAGGLNTATEPFAVTLRMYNLSGADDDSLLAALDRDKKNEEDSDRDRFSDYDEIAVHGTDPNDAADKPTPPSGTGGTPSGTGGAGVGGDTGAAGAGPGAGGALGTSGAPSAGGTVDEPEPEPEFCIAPRKIFPTPEYGCQIGAGSAAGVPLGAALLIGCCLLARRGRSRSRSRSRSRLQA